MRINPSTGKIVSRDNDFCPYCDAYLYDDNYEYCDECNMYVGIVSKEYEETMVTVECLNCGTTNNILNEYCINCGESPTDNLYRCDPDNPTLDGLEVICGNCLEYNSIHRDTCYNCGKKLNKIN